MMFLPEDTDIVLRSSQDKVLTVNTEKIPEKTTRSSQGVQVMTLRKNAVVAEAVAAKDAPIANYARYRSRNIPAAGSALRDEDKGIEQLGFRFDENE